MDDFDGCSGIADMLFKQSPVWFDGRIDRAQHDDSPTGVGRRCRQRLVRPYDRHIGSLHAVGHGPKRGAGDDDGIRSRRKIEKAAVRLCPEFWRYFTRCLHRFAQIGANLVTEIRDRQSKIDCGIVENASVAVNRMQERNAHG